VSAIRSPRRTGRRAYPGIGLTPLAIRSEEVNHLAIKLAAQAEVGKSEAVRRALGHEIARAGRR
jgi:hypothetical protein